MNIESGPAFPISESRKVMIFLWTLLAGFCMWGCNEGKELPSGQNPVGPSLSPTLSNLTISGSKLSRVDGGILKLTCQWTSAKSASSATAYLAFVQSMDNPLVGPTGVVVSSGTIVASGTSTPTASVEFPGSGGNPLPLLLAIGAQTTPASSTATGTTASSTSSGATASSTKPQTASSPSTPPPAPTPIPASSSAPVSQPASGTSLASGTTGTASTTTPVASPTVWFYQNISNPLTIPTGIATTQQSGAWKVEIPFPSAVLKGTITGKLQALLWMVINDRKTNTLAFEIEVSD